jgi:hypothetical protein
MKLELESTPDLVTIDGHRARVWKGTYKGAPVVAFVSSIAVLEEGTVCEDFARELHETRPPVGAVDAASRAIR